MPILSYENEISFTCKLNSFVHQDALRKRLKVIRKWPIECLKAKTKVITLANHKEHGQSSEPIKTRVITCIVADVKRGNTSASASRLILV